MDQFSGALSGSGIFGGQSQSYWEKRRNKVKAIVYPDGILTTLPDAATTNPFSPDLLPGCAQVIQYATDDPGGRSGGTPLYSHLCIPSAPAVGKCLIFLAGHILVPWREFYALSDGSSFVLRMLARGWHVLAVDMPGLGDQPSPQSVVIGGTPVTPNPVHAYAAAFSDGGPDANRIFLDHIIRSANQITETYGITEFALSGHSGGADTAVMLAAVDDRYRVVHLLSGGWYSETFAADACIEGWTNNPAIAAASFGTAHALHWVYTAASALPGRKTLVHSSPTDTQYNYQGDWGAREFAYWQAWTPRVQNYLGSWATVALYERVGDHNPTSDEAAFIENYLLTNM